MGPKWDRHEMGRPQVGLTPNGTLGPEMGWARNGTGPKWDTWARNGMGTKWDGPEMARPEMAGPKWVGPKWPGPKWDRPPPCPSNTAPVLLFSAVAGKATQADVNSASVKRFSNS